MEKIVGIDLGTTNSCISFIESGEVVVVPNFDGARTTPSVVAFTPSGERLIGISAKRQAIINAENTVFAVKRLIGRKLSSPEVQELQKRVGYRMTEASNGDVRLLLADKVFAPQEISAMILSYLRDTAEAYIGEKVNKAVITVPANFDDAQRQATKDAGTIAGLEVVRIINEPTAAALAYGYHKRKEGLIAVFDLGGGTFDISILEIRNGVFHVLSTAGDTFLGGDDIDNLLIDFICEEFKNKHGVELWEKRETLQRLKEACEKAKIELSYNPTAEINLPFIADIESKPLHLSRIITREEIENLTVGILSKIPPLLGRAIDDANISKKDIDEVILVGGQTRMPKIIDLVREYFEKEPNISINPDEVVSIGAAVQGSILSGEVYDIVLLDVTPLSLGVETKGDRFVKIIERNTTIPVRKSMTFTTVEDNQRTVKIHVLQGEREIASANRSLGYFYLTEIFSAPAGIPQINVSFEIDSNGIVKVSATDRATGKVQQMVVEPSSGLTPQEIERMVQEAERFREEDRRRMEVKRLKDELDSIIWGIKDSLNKATYLLKGINIEELWFLISKAESAINRNDIDEIKKFHSDLNEIKERLTQIIMSKL
ncbi:MAG: molecular chaperone DnaK [Candidatus Aminicenantia bacterium]